MLFSLDFWQKTVSYEIALLYNNHRSSHRRCFVKKGVLRNFTKLTGNSLYARVPFLINLGPRPATLLKKRLALVFSSEFYEISMNTFLYRTSLVAAASTTRFLSFMIYLNTYYSVRFRLQ